MGFVKTKDTKRGVLITTPAARAGFVALDVPSTKFKDEGEYSITVIMPAAEKATKELLAVLDDMMERSERAALAQTGKKKVKLASPPYRNEEDDDGIETGNIKINFKLPAKFVKTDDDGNVLDTIHYRPGKFDSQGNALGSKVRIGSGSLVKVAAEASPYFTEGLGAGVKLRLKTVMVLELVEANGQMGFEASGFEREEGGFVFQASQAEANDNIAADNEGATGATDEADF